MMDTAFRRRGFRSFARLAVALAFVISGASLLMAKGPSVRQENGKYFDKEDTITYNVGDDGKVDWYTYSGFRRYHSECHVCHGPDGLGSTYAPALADSMKNMNYADYLNIVASGRKNVSANQNSYMPAFGENLNVMCYAEDIFVYLKARADNALPRGRPEKREDKPEAAKQYEKSCLGN
jgi:methanol metabolism-related c-type cytochrome